jgi:hypothetical protein
MFQALSNNQGLLKNHQRHHVPLRPAIADLVLEQVLIEEQASLNPKLAVQVYLEFQRRPTH